MPKPTNNLPKISIITPSYNQGPYIKQTIDSVLSQNYPNLDYWVIDGGSNDETVKILKSYGKQINWISEKDKGQTDAINKGLKHVTGDILAYLNSDDLYLPDTLSTVANYFTGHPNCHWLTGTYQIINEHNQPVPKQSIVVTYKQFLLANYSYFLLKITNSIIPQPSTFWSRQAFEKIGLFDDSLHYTMDYDYWLRLGKHYPLHYIKQPLSQFRVHTTSKSTTGYLKQFAEEQQVLQKNSSAKLDHVLHKLHTYLALLLYKHLK